MREIVDRPIDGRIKLYVIWRMLQLRREKASLCTAGRYVALEASGSKKDHLCAFARKSPQAAILVVVPRLVAGLVGESDGPPIGPEVWGDTSLQIPQQCRGGSFRNILTGEEIDGSSVFADASSPGRLSIATVLGSFPVAVLQRID